MLFVSDGVSLRGSGRARGGMLDIGSKNPPPQQLRGLRICILKAWVPEIGHRLLCDLGQVAGPLWGMGNGTPVLGEWRLRLLSSVG